MLKGSDVTLTINSKAQAAAYNALAALGKPGAVVALNPKTGAILAMASYPSYDPNVLATHDGTKLNQADRQLLANKAQPLLNRVLQGTYPPGSTFTIVTSSALLTQRPEHHGQHQRRLADPAHAAADHPRAAQRPRRAVRRRERPGAADHRVRPVLRHHLRQDRHQLGAPALNDMAEKFGMNDPNLTVPLPVAKSNYVIPPSQALTAFSAIGQFSDTVTPLQVAMFAAAIANGGTLMKPYLVKQVTASDLSARRTRRLRC